MTRPTQFDAKFNASWQAIYGQCQRLKPVRVDALALVVALSATGDDQTLRLLTVGTKVVTTTGFKATAALSASYQMAAMCEPMNYDKFETASQKLSKLHQIKYDISLL